MKGHRDEGNTIVLLLRAGGEIVFESVSIARISPDEVPYPEPEGDAPQGCFALWERPEAAAPGPGTRELQLPINSPLRRAGSMKLYGRMASTHLQW